MKILEQLLGTQRLEKILSSAFVVALSIPTFFVAIVIGGNFGGAIGAGADEFLGNSSGLILVGIFLGVVVVFLLLLTVSALLGRGLAMLINRIVGQRI